MTYLSADPFRNIFYFAGSSRDPLLPSLFSEMTSQIPLTPFLPPHPRSSTGLEIPSRYLTLYSLEEQRTLVINLVNDEDEIDRLERVIYPGCIIRFDPSDEKLSYPEQYAPLVIGQNKEAVDVLWGTENINAASMRIGSLDSGPILRTKSFFVTGTKPRYHIGKEGKYTHTIERKGVFEELGLAMNKVDHIVDMFRHLVEEKLYTLLVSGLGIDDPLAALSSSGSSANSDSCEGTEEDGWEGEIYEARV